MTQGDEWKWMISKLSGNSNPEEDNLLTIWLNTSRQNQVLFDEVTKLWESSTVKLKLNDPATEEEWKKLQEQIQNDTVKTNWISLPQTWLAVAASIIILIGVIYYVRPSSDNLAGPSIVEKQTESKSAAPANVTDSDIHIVAASEVMTIKLPDGSQAWLNSHSAISYSPSFTQNRIVHLSGEGYFIVIPDAKHPFSVRTKNINTHVIGTSFNIKEEDSTVSVTVAKGKVKMTDEHGLTEVMLSAKEKGTYQDGKVTKAPNNQSAFASWREKNNPSYEEERKIPSSYLKNTYSWKKNQINRSVIEGSLTNNASLATYHRIVLKATYLKPKSKKTATVRIAIEEPVRPGQTINYQKKLLDILTHTHDFKVEIEKVETIPNHYF
ncbi:MAG TPA: FecR family protein [Cyclobacteriaceae bacterium]